MNVSHAKANLAFINLEKIINNTDYGKEILNEIKLLKNKDYEKLKEMENQLKSSEDQLNKKRNIISENDYEKQIKNLTKKISEYRTFKNNVTINFENNKKKYLNTFFSKINPLIQEYMDEQQIDILLNQENIFIGKNSVDITDTIIKILNLKIN